MKIYSFPSHGTKQRVSGVDYARIIQPSKYLAKHFEVKIYNPRQRTKDNWPEVAQDYDVIFFNYTLNAWAFAHMGCMVRKFNKKMVLDIDDNLWNVLPDNPVYESFKKGSEGIHNLNSIIREVDLVTCTNQYLKNVIHHNTGKELDKIKVLPNRIDFKLYNSTPEPRHRDDVVIGHMGSTTHFNSLLSENFVNGMKLVMAEYPHVKFRTIGSFVPEFRKLWGLRYENDFGDVDILRWVKKMPEMLKDVDFMVTPLTDNIYNRCKSSIKWLEASSAKRTGCWQAIRQYKEVITGENGFLCNSPESWFNSMKILIEDKKRRDTMAEKAYQDVKENWTIQDHIGEYQDLISSLTEKK